MQVETFEVTELTSCDSVIAEEELEQFKSAIESLNLEGQKAFIGGEEKKEIVPYRKMTAQEKMVYGLLCPAKSELSKYSDSAIPLRVLQIASHVSSLKICDTLWVWSAENADVKDPVLVGIKGSEWSGEFFILARWGDELASFKELMEKAKAIKKNLIALSIVQIRQKLAVVESSIDERAEEAVLTGKDKSLTFYD